MRILPCMKDVELCYGNITPHFLDGAGKSVMRGEGIMSNSVPQIQKVCEQFVSNLKG